METQSYFLILRIEHPSYPDDPHAPDLLDGKFAIARLPDLTKDEAETVRQAVELHDEELFSTIGESWMEAEADAQTKPGRHLILCKQARETEAAAQSESRGELKGAGRLSLAAIEHAAEVRKIRRDTRNVTYLRNLCRQHRAALLKQKAKDTGITSYFCQPGANDAVYAALQIVVDLGGMDFASSMLKQQMSFDDGDGAIQRLEEIERWCDSCSSQGKSEVETPTSNSARWEVLDKDDAKVVVFDATGAEHWGPVSEDEDWNDAEQSWAFRVDRTLYRHPEGPWTLVSDRVFQLDYVPPGIPEATRLTDAEAADWLVRHGFQAPADVAHLTAAAFFVPGLPSATKPEPVRDVPIWNKERCELTYRGQVIRRVPRPKKAKNVIRVLDAFQEDGWPDRIDDPLDPSESTLRLHETIKRLNDNLKVIRFRADGTGEGIMWELIAPDTPPERTELPF